MISETFTIQAGLWLGATLLALGLCAPASAAEITSPAQGHSGRAQENPSEFVSPIRALLSPSGGRLEASQKAVIMATPGGKTISFILPGDAENLQMSVAEHSVVRWSSAPLILNQASAHHTKRAEIEHQRDLAYAQLETLKARIAAWQMQTPEAGSQELAQRQALMGDALPPLVQAKEELERKLRLLGQELDQLPVADGIGRQITAVLSGKGDPGQEVEVSYSYDLPVCGWSASYNFDAQPDEKGDTVKVQLIAEIWQYTGMDWAGTEVTLASRGNGSREPQPLPEWIIGTERPKPQPRAAMLSAKAAAPEAMAITADEANIAPPAVSGNTDSVYATWTLGSRGLPEGRSRLQIFADEWKAPLEWLARPTRGDGRVWLMTKYRLPEQYAWPAGTAQFSVNGQNIGAGTFRPTNGYATLYFGADPRVNVRTIVDSSKQGETGIINTNRTWTWGWTYVLSNEHNKPVKVRVERPEPRIVNESVSVSYNDQPPSKKDEKEHMLYWDADVPAHGKTSIKHEVTVTAPVKLDLLPDVP